MLSMSIYSVRFFTNYWFSQKKYHFYDASTYKLQLQQRILSTIFKQDLQCILQTFASTSFCGTGSHNNSSIIRKVFYCKNKSKQL